MVNWAEADFTYILVSGSNTCIGVLKAEGEKHGLTIATFNQRYRDPPILTRGMETSQYSPEIWRPANTRQRYGDQPILTRDIEISQYSPEIWRPANTHQRYRNQPILTRDLGFSQYALKSITTWSTGLRPTSRASS